MTKQLTRISILQSSKTVTALYILMGFIYTLIGIPMLIFGGEQIKVMAIIYLAMPVLMAIRVCLLCDLRCALQPRIQVVRRNRSRS